MEPKLGRRMVYLTLTCTVICLTWTCTALLTKLESSSKLATRANIAENNDDRTSVTLKTITDTKEFKRRLIRLHTSRHTTFAVDRAVSDELRDLRKNLVFKRLQSGDATQANLKSVNGTSVKLVEEYINEYRHGPKYKGQRQTYTSGSYVLRRSKRNVNGTTGGAKSSALFDDNNNTAMYLVLPLIILVYGGCCSSYCIYKLKIYIRKTRLMRKRKQLAKKQGREHFPADESSVGIVNDGFENVPDNESENQPVNQDKHKHYVSENKLLKELEYSTSGGSQGNSNPPPGYLQMDVAHQIAPTNSSEVDSLSSRMSVGLPKPMDDEDSQIEEIRAAMDSVLILNTNKTRISGDIQSTCFTTLRRSSVSSSAVTSHQAPSLKIKQQSIRAIGLPSTERKTTQSKTTTRQQSLKSRQSLILAKREATAVKTKQSKREIIEMTTTTKTPQDDINYKSFGQQSGGVIVDRSKDIVSVKSKKHSNERSVEGRKHQNITSIIRQHQGAMCTESMIETSGEVLTVSKQIYEMEVDQQEIMLKNNEEIKDCSNRSTILADRRSSGVKSEKSNMAEKTKYSIDIDRDEKNKVDFVSSDKGKLVRVNSNQTESTSQDHFPLSKRSSAESGIFEQEDTKPIHVVNHKPDDVPMSGENSCPIMRRKKVKQKVFSCS